MSSSSSSSRARGSWLGVAGTRRSPIPYRRGPLDYEPAVMCHCGKKAALWISWSEDNPGRRYFKCYNARFGGCDFICWYKGPDDGFVHGLLIDLRDAVWSLKQQREELQAALADAMLKIDKQKVTSEKENGVDVKQALKEGPMKQKTDKKKLWLFGVSVSVAAAVAFMHLS